MKNASQREAVVSNLKGSNSNVALEGANSTSSSTRDLTIIANKKRARTSEDNTTLKLAKQRKVETQINPHLSERLDIYVFGRGEFGELGLGDVRRNGKEPRNVTRPRLNDLVDANNVGVVQIAVGGMHCVALTYDHKIYSWGVNDLGALGRVTNSDDSNEEANESTPTPIDAIYFGKNTKFVQVIASDNASFALTDVGAVYGWGTFRVSATLLYSGVELIIFPGQRWRLWIHKSRRSESPGA